MKILEYIEQLKEVAEKHSNLDLKYFQDNRFNSYTPDIVNVEKQDLAVVEEYSLGGNSYYIPEGESLENFVGRKQMAYTDNVVKGKYIALNQDKLLKD